MSAKRNRGARAAEDVLSPGINWGEPGLAWRALYGAITEALAREAGFRTGFLWLPVAFGLGILGYFAATTEPYLWAGAALAALLLVPATLLAGSARVLAIAVLFTACGFSAATWRTALVASPMLDRDVFGETQGFVEAVDIIRNRQRVTLRPSAIEGISAASLPYRVRVGVPGRSGITPGSFIKVRTRLMPPSEAAMPGGYDFRRDAFFRSTGAVGYAIGKVSTEKAPHAPALDLRLRAAVDAGRNALTLRIASAIGGDSGALAAALITGKRGLISGSANDDLRAAGLYHIVSISGLHMVLAAGVMFWALRALLAISPFVALHFPIRKIAAAGAMAGATAYCVFSGAEVATVRSLIMTLVMLGAILVDRPALAMRNLAISALIVLAREPEALIGPSFQMSFAAVGCLIAANRVWADWRQGRPSTRERSAFERAGVKLLLGFAGILATTLIATLATAPFSAFHFHRLNSYGIIGNALGIPLVSLLVMPSAVAGTLLVPFGLDAYVWRIMGEGVSGVLAVAGWVASIEHATLSTPQIKGLTFALMVMAVLAFIGFRTRLRWSAALPLGLSFLAMSAPERPDIIVDPGGRLALVRAGDGRYRVLSTRKADTFTLSQWLPALGDSRQPDAASLRQDVYCDTAGCVATLPDGRKVALVSTREALREDCRRADIIITSLPEIAACASSGKKLLARAHFETHGATLIHSAQRGEWRLTTTLDPRIERPWRRKSQRTPQNTAATITPANPVLPLPPSTPDDDPALQPAHQ